MQLKSKSNKGVKYILCAIDLFSKYAFAVPLKDKKGSTIVNAIQIILGNAKRKPNKIWVNQGSEFYNKSFKKWLKDNNTIRYSTHNEGKSVVAERFIRTFKNQIYKQMTADKMKPIHVKNDSFAKYNEKSNEKDPKFKIGHHVRTSKYKNIFAKGYAPNWSDKMFVVKKIKNTVPWTL